MTTPQHDAASEALAMKLISTVEALVEPGRGPQPGGPWDAIAAPYRVPPTLAALWQWSHQEVTNGLFLLASAVLPGFPHDEDSLMAAVSNVQLRSPHDAASPREDWPADWLSVGDTGGGDVLVVDGDGGAWLWSSNIDVEPVLVHPSFDGWLRELGQAIDAGRFVITRDDAQHSVVVDGAWVYDLHDYGWAKVP